MVCCRMGRRLHAHFWCRLHCHRYPIALLFWITEHFNVDPYLKRKHRMSRLCDLTSRARGLFAAAALLLMFLCTAPTPAAIAPAGDVEYFGKLETELAPYRNDLDQIVFKPFRELAKIKFA